MVAVRTGGRVMSAIEWTDATWNPTTGCDQVSPGCDNCYALTMAKRLKAMGQAKYQTDGDPRTSGPGFGLAMHSDVLEQPLRWRKPRRVFVNSMSDLFHPRVTDEFLSAVWEVMEQAVHNGHVFQVLTKRPKRMRAFVRNRYVSYAEKFKDCPTEAMRNSPAAQHARECARNGWPGIWLGTSVEDQQRADERVPPLLDTPADIRFISAEPLLGPVTFRWLNGVGYKPGWRERGEIQRHLDALKGIDWVIIGGESGKGARPMNPVWARTIIDQCQAAQVAVFVKQFGAWVPVRDEPRPGDLAAHRDGRIGDPADVKHGVDSYWTLRRSGSHHGDPDEWPPRFRVREFPRDLVRA